MEEKNKTKEILEWVYCILIAIVIVLIIKSFIGVPTVVKQESMYPTLKQNERLWLNRVGATFNKMPKIFLIQLHHTNINLKIFLLNLHTIF